MVASIGRDEYWEGTEMLFSQGIYGSDATTALDSFLDRLDGPFPGWYEIHKQLRPMSIDEMVDRFGWDACRVASIVRALGKGDPS